MNNAVAVVAALVGLAVAALVLGTIVAIGSLLLANGAHTPTLDPIDGAGAVLIAMGLGTAWSAAGRIQRAGEEA